MRRFPILPLATLALTACAPLTAERPLFSPAHTPDALAEGVWVSNGAGCVEAARGQARLPEPCIVIDLRRTEDGAWRVSMSAPGDDGPKAEELLFRGVLAPAVERGGEDAPLYVFERVEEEAAPGSLRYDAVIPLGEHPAHELYLLPELACDEILRDGPVEGVSEIGRIGPLRRACNADTPAAARAAARRVVIENLGALENNRFVFVRR